MNLYGPLIIGLIGIWAAMAILAAPRLTSVLGLSPSGPRLWDAVAFVVVPLALAFWLVGLRPLAPPAGDTNAYVKTFEALDGPIGARAVGHQWFGSSELLFWPIQGLIEPWGSPRTFLVLNFVAVVFASALAYRAITRHWGPHAWLLFSLVFLTYFCVYAGNGMRQALAIPFALAGATFVWNKRWLAGAACVFLAVGFHWTSVATLAVLVFKVVPLNKKVMVATPLIALVSSQLLFHWLLELVAASFLEDTFLGERAAIYSEGVMTTADPRTSINLWIAVGLYVLTILGRWNEDTGDQLIRAYACLFMTLVLATLGVEEVWVRFLVNLMFLTPILGVLWIRQLRLGPRPAVGAVALASSTLFVAWLFSYSAQVTLGFTL